MIVRALSKTPLMTSGDERGEKEREEERVVPVG